LCRNTPGQIRALDALPWPQQSRYRQQEFKPWYYTDGKGQAKKGGMTKAVEKLLFVSVDNAGHDVPSGQPEAVHDVLLKWMKREMMRTTLGASSGQKVLEQ